MQLPTSSNGQSSQRSLATARWATPDEVAQRRYRPGAIWLGRADDDDESPVGIADDRHVLLVAGGRNGKGANIIVPTICTWLGSVVVIDPKGENAAVTYARRGAGSEQCDGLGQEVFLFDPFRAANLKDVPRASYNPLDALDINDEETADEAGRIADALVIGKNQNDPYWDDQARNFIKAIILHVITKEHFEGRRNLITVRSLITSGDVSLRNYAQSSAAEGQYIPSSFEILFMDMRSNNSFFGVISQAGEAFGNLQVNSSKTMSSILSTASNHTAFLDSLPMHRALSETTPGFSLSRIKTDPLGISVFLSLPQRYMNTHAGWLRMMVSLITTEMERVPGRPAAKAPILMILDEFAGLKKMEVIEHATAQIAGFGVKLMFVVQTFTQLKSIYEDNWEVFVANAGTKIFFGIDDHFTRDYTSKYLGETEITRLTKTGSETQGVSSTTSQGSTSAFGETFSQTTGGSSNFTKTRGSSVSSDIGFFWDSARTKSKSVDSSTSTGSTWSSQSGSSTSTSSNISQSSGYNESSTSGLNEAIHKRALLTPDEIGVIFQRIEDGSSSAYPGLALVAAKGAPMIVRRVNYFEDVLFERLYVPHPDHAPVPKRGPRVRVKATPEIPKTVTPPTAVLPIKTPKKKKPIAFVITILAFVSAIGNLFFKDPKQDTHSKLSEISSDLNARINRCDTLAASDLDVDRPAGVAGVPTKDVKGQDAIEACTIAMASDPDNPRIKYELSRAIYATGTRHFEVRKLALEAAQSGYAAAMANYAVLLVDTNFQNPPSAVESLKWAQAAAQKGNPLGMYVLGTNLIDGTAVQKDVLQAADWLQKSANAGYTPAMISIGWMHYNGVGVPKDIAKAKGWLRSAVDKGDISALKILNEIGN